MSGSLAKLVATLPEVYQPILGHPELSQQVSRACEDRLQSILEIYRALETKLNRPLRVLDLGCAQGFFCLSLAKLGARTHGVDFLHGNIAVCEALACESPGVEATFELARVETALAALTADQYDLVLGLSVFHHISHQIGPVAVQRMLAALSEKVAAGIFELALAGEPAPWAVSQPANPRQILAGFGFVIEVARNETHLSELARPLYFASSRYWRLGERTEAFDRWTSEAHPYGNGASFGTRRYFFGGGRFAKLFMLDYVKTRAANLRDHRNEAALLSAPPPGFDAPQLLLYGHSEREAWLVREELPGDLLIDRILAGAPYDATSVLMDVLKQLATLEAAGLHHNDVRAWNVLVAPDGRAALIDYGAISRDRRDCGWPHDLFLSFLIFAHEVFSGKVENLSPLRTPALNPEGLPEPWRSAFWRMFAAPQGEWRFALLRDWLEKDANDPASAPSAGGPGLGAALQAMEEACALYRAATAEWRSRAIQAEASVQQLQSQAAQSAASNVGGLGGRGA